MQRLLFIALLCVLAALIYEQMMDETVYAFTANWYDEEASLNRNFKLFYFPTSNKIQLFEPRTQKIFLKKSSIEGLRGDDIFVGNTILILSRLFTINDYSDEFTKKALSSKTERTFAMIKPDCVKHMGAVMKYIQENDLKIRAASMAIMKDIHAQHFYQEHIGKPFLPSLIEYVTSGPVLAMQLQGDDAVKKWRKIIGPTDPEEAIVKDPKSLRARFGHDKTYNGFHGADAVQSGLREISIFFPNDEAGKKMAPQSSAKFNNCTCCIIKPHVLQEGKLGDILSAINEGGFEITGLEMVRFDRASAAEFHEVYDGVLYEYMDMVTQLQSGPSVVLEVKPKDELSEPVDGFRKLVGPMDPDLAKKIRPDSLRARFGMTTIKNAIHCTDLEQDGILELEYAFKIMRGKF